MLGDIGLIIAEIQKMQQDLKNKTIEISEGEGAFKIIINAHQEVLEVIIDPAILSPEHREELQKIVSVAFNRATSESKQIFRDEISKITGGMNFPGIPGLL